MQSAADNHSMQIHPRLSPKATGIAAAVVTVVVWTAFIIIARGSAARNLTPLDLTFARIVGASLVLVPLGWWMVRREGLAGWLGVSPVPFKITAQCGLFGGLLFGVLVYTGFAYAPAAHASVLLPGSLPLWTALLALWLLGTPITPARGLGLLLIVVGDLLVGGASLLQAFDGGNVWRGDLLFMSAAVCWSIYSVLARRHLLNAVVATTAITVFALVCFVPVYLTLVATGVVVSRLTTAPIGEVLFQMAFQGLGSVVVSGISFTMMIQYFGPVRSTMITAVVPGLSALGAVWVLAEPLHWNLLAGLMLVTVGIVFGVRSVTR